MRILHIEKMLFRTSGVTSYVRGLSDYQRRRGHEVCSFGCAGPDEPTDRVRYFDFTKTRNPLTLLRMIHNRQAAADLSRFLRNRRVDIAHVHNLYHHLTPSVLEVLSARRIPIVMTVHDYRLMCPTKHFLRSDAVCLRCLPNRFYHAASPKCAGLGGIALAIESYIQRFFRRYYQPIELFLCPTQYMRQTLLKTHLPANKSAILRNIVEPIALPRDEKQSDCEILFVGRLTVEKSPHLMLDLARLLPEAHIVIVGEGPLLGKLRDKVATAGLTNVTITGHVNHEDLGAYLARATTVVVTSRWIENSPHAMLEPMLAGRCVIVPDHPPLREWISDGLTGRLFRPGDAESLVKVAKEVLGHPESREKIALTGKTLVDQRHNPEHIISQLDGFYEDAIDRCALR
ncbi:MAG: glycosyltransferase family 4 protein [Phycisphaerae bacterium]|nr:glycosyltransferase family 4 protein [Phycisphaerae bacterium]